MCLVVLVTRLMFQDHNYGAQPPPTPPQTPPLVATPIKESEMKEDIVVTSEVPSNPQPVSSPLPQESVDQDDPTRCICDFIHDDGYMIQCDKCRLVCCHTNNLRWYFPASFALLDCSAEKPLVYKDSVCFKWTCFTCLHLLGL